MVTSLVLLAPSGLIRIERLGRIAQFLYFSGLVPDNILRGLSGYALQQPTDSAATENDSQADATVASSDNDPTNVKDSPPIVDASSFSTLEERVSQHTRWMVAHHPGFVQSFVSCMRHAPLTHQHETWKLLAKRKPLTTAVFLAKDDEIVHSSDYERDGLSLLGGPEHVYWKVLSGKHSFVMTNADDIVRALDNFWDKKTAAH